MPRRSLPSQTGRGPSLCSGRMYRSSVPPDVPERRDERVGKLGIVDVAGVAGDRTVSALVDSFFYCAKERLVGGRVVKRLSLGVDQGDALFREEKAHGSGHLVELGADPLSHFTVLFHGCAHESNVGVVFV